MRAVSTSLKLRLMKKLLVVCMGNICRSPMAQVALQTQATRGGLAATISVDSAGTHASSFGEKPDSRAEAALLRRGHEIGRLRCRRVIEQDFSKFDLILAMDSDNLADMQEICPPDQAHKLHLFLQYGAAPADGSRPSSGLSAPCIRISRRRASRASCSSGPRIFSRCRAP